jgi:hypothetical protein
MHVGWTLQQDALGGVFIYRSLTGSGGWEILNEASPVDARIGSFTDTTYRQKSYNETVHYRALLQTPDGKLIPSEPVGVLEDLTRMEKSGIALMIQEEYRVMRQQGVPVLLYFPLYTGVTAPGYDPHSKQAAVFEAAPADPALDNYGQPFVGGFQTPLRTRIILDGINPGLTAKDPARKISGPVKRSARMMAFPRPRADCLIVMPRTDERFIIGDSVMPLSFKGVYPVAYKTELEALPKSDARYRVPVPKLTPEP